MSGRRRPIFASRALPAREDVIALMESDRFEVTTGVQGVARPSDKWPPDHS